jgi:hypothetical protein
MGFTVMKTKLEILKDLKVLLYHLCNEYGFCNDLNPEDFFESRETLSSTEFVDAVLSAESMIPDHEVR